MQYTIIQMIAKDCFHRTYLLNGDDNKQYVFKNGIIDTGAMKVLSELVPCYTARIYEATKSTLLTDFVYGYTLNEMKIPEPEIYQIIYQLCAALSAMHHAGVLYLDMKPENVVIDNEGKITIIDLESAVLKSNLPYRLKFLGCSGQFSAPELHKNESASERSDIYSLGMTIKSVLNGDINFSPLKVIIERCTAPDPGQRYGSVDEVAADVKAVSDKLSKYVNL